MCAGSVLGQWFRHAGHGADQMSIWGKVYTGTVAVPLGFSKQVYQALSSFLASLRLSSMMPSTIALHIVVVQVSWGVLTVPCGWSLVQIKWQKGSRSSGAFAMSMVGL